MQNITFSPTGWATSQVETNLSLHSEDTLPKKGVKIVSRTLTSTAITLAGLTETIFFAALTILTAPLGLHTKTRAPFTSMKNHTAIAASTSFRAAKGIFGINSNPTKPQSKVTDTYQKMVPLFLRSSYKSLETYCSQGLTSLKNRAQKTTSGQILTGLAIAAIIGLGIYYHSDIKNLLSGSPSRELNHDNLGTFSTNPLRETIDGTRNTETLPASINVDLSNIGLGNQSAQITSESTGESLNIDSESLRSRVDYSQMPSLSSLLNTTQPENLLPPHQLYGISQMPSIEFASSIPDSEPFTSPLNATQWMNLFSRMFSMLPPSNFSPPLQLNLGNITCIAEVGRVPISAKEWFYQGLSNCFKAVSNTTLDWQSCRTSLIRKSLEVGHHLMTLPTYSCDPVKRCIENVGCHT